MGDVYGRLCRYGTRKDLLEHFNREITTHYSAPELENLIAASEKVCVNDSRKSHAIVMLQEKCSMRQMVITIGLVRGFLGYARRYRNPDLLIRSPKKLVLHGQFLPYILSVMFFVVPCCDIPIKKCEHFYQCG